ncbi:hypothetical protein GCM10009839_15960 [Catenulispora yoronensis]|uniref:Restriction endonuclease domain-containing protein n=1 Tax=Catenulispora yoronensis TaxID=450799 RepID=A0ABP5FAF2_9ACTN
MATATLRMKADLPGDERDLVASGEIGSWLGFRHSSRVEIIGGDVFVSWAAGLTAGQTFSKILTALVNSRGDGCPRDVRMLVDGDVDFAVVEVERWAESMARFTSPWLGELVAIEVTTPDAGTGRGPGALRRRAHPTRTELARLGVPCYVLVDRAPDVAEAYVFAKPDVEAGRFTRSDTVAFGEAFRLPEPIGVTVCTAGWRAWDTAEEGLVEGLIPGPRR